MLDERLPDDETLGEGVIVPLGLEEGDPNPQTPEVALQVPKVEM